jgi:hypothetical protein
VKGIPKLWPNKLVWEAEAWSSSGMGWSGWKTKHGEAVGGERMLAMISGLAKADEQMGSGARSIAAEQGREASEVLNGGTTSGAEPSGSAFG